MKILVTGGGGFLGQALCRGLVERGHDVASFNRGRYPALDAIGVRQLRGDLADRDAVLAAAQGLAQKATTAGDEDLHACGSLCAAAHAASVSRPILALWRISTGKPGCGRNLAMRAVCG